MIITILVVSIFVLQFAICTGVDAATPIAVSLNAPSQVNVGDNFNVTVNIGQVSDFYGIQFDLLYDSAVFQYVSTTWGQIGPTAMSGNGPALSENIAAGDQRLLVSLTGLSSGISGAGTVATVQFKVENTTIKTTSLNLANGVMSDFDANPIAATWAGSSVTIMGLVSNTTTTTIPVVTTTTTLTTTSTSAATTTTIAVPTTTAATSTIIPTTTTTSTTVAVPNTTPAATTTRAATTLPAATTTPMVTSLSAPVVTAETETVTGTLDISNDINAGGVITPVILKSSDDNAIIDIPAGTMGTTPSGAPLGSLTVVAVSDPPAPPPAGESIISTVYEFGPSGARFSSPVTLTLSYDPTQLSSGFPVVGYYNATNGQWITIGGVVNSDTYKVTVQVDHFAIFAVMQEISTTMSPKQKSYAAMFVIIAAIFFIGIILVILLVAKRKGKTSI